MGYVFYVFIGILIAIGAVFFVGYTFDKERRHKKEILIEAPVQAVWDVVTKFDKQADWRKDVSEVVFLSDEKWIEIPYKGRDFTFEIVEKELLKHWILDIYIRDKKIGYWIVEFTDVQKTTKVVFTEVLITRNPFMRVISRLFFNMDK